MDSETQTRLQQLLALFRQRGHRLSPQRIAIVKALVEHQGHPSVEQLHLGLLSRFPAMSLATVYKTLAVLKELGEVLELGSGDLGSRYDGRRPDPHPHLICTRCGLVVDPDPANDNVLQILAESLATQNGFALHRHRLDLFGLCPACRTAG